MDKEDGDTTTTNADTFDTDALKSCRPAPTPPEGPPAGVVSRWVIVVSRG
ncbi:MULTISPECIES: hypothetical protein [Streptomycetaceae]|nr:hypothetical protein [Streptomyces sp. CB02056]